MSMCLCDRCERFIDSDEDPDCFVEVPGDETLIACESCRDDMDESGELDVETNTLNVAPITKSVASFSPETLRFAEQCAKEQESK